MSFQITLLAIASVGCGAEGPRLHSPVIEADRPESPSPPQSERQDSRGELDVVGDVSELSISPSGRLWLTTSVGESFWADAIDGDWQPGSLSVKRGERSEGNKIDRITFFDASHAIATGYLGPRRDTLYRTSDGGQSWVPIDFGESEWIYDAHATTAGRAWIGGSRGNLLFTDDFGDSWSALTPPFDTSHRTHAIFMDRDGRSGVVGSVRNALKTTDDGGRTWSEIPTPLDQGKLPPPTVDDDDRIETVAFVGRQLVVAQRGRVFHSARDAIAWQAFDPVLTAFDASPSGDEMVAVTADATVVRLTASLTQTVLAGGRRIEGAVRDVRIGGARVYLLGSGLGVHEVSDGGATFSHPLTSSHPTAQSRMLRVRRHDGTWWGSTDFHIYNSDDGGAGWHRVAQTPQRIAGFVPIDADRVLLWDGLELNRLFDRRTGELTVVETLEGRDVADVIRTSRGFLAYGGGQPTFDGSVTSSDGFVFESQDATDWEAIDAWADEGVARLFADEDFLFLVSYRGAIRHLHRRPDGYFGSDVLPATSGNATVRPLVQMIDAFYFDDEQHGFVRGRTHRATMMLDVVYATTDGGQTWSNIDAAQFPFRHVTAVGNGHVGTDGHAVYRLTGGAREEVLRVSEPQPDDVWETMDELPDNPRITDLSLADNRVFVEIAARDASLEERIRQRSPPRTWRLVE